MLFCISAIADGIIISEDFLSANDKGKMKVISTMHDLTVSGLYPDRLLLLAEGSVVVSGSAESVLTPENIAKHYGAKVTVITHESGPVVIPERSK